MASLQAPQEINSVQFIEPIELEYNQGRGANWVLPTKERPDAFLIDAITIDVTGEADRKADAFRSFKTLKVGFELEVDTRSFGFKNSNVHIGFKLATDLMYVYQSVQKQIAEMKPGHKTWVTAEFPAVNETPLLGGKIYFQLMDRTAEVPKGGLKLSKAMVEQVGYTN